ncbi:MAG: hypothetical protein M0Z63_02615 [Actinomycetota bacterium]|nr:hypothetical protein [Actinomycetota bacterium]
MAEENEQGIAEYLVEVWRAECRRHGDDDRPWPGAEALGIAAALTGRFDDDNEQVVALEQQGTAFLRASDRAWAVWRLKVLDRVLRAGGSEYGLAAIGHLLEPDPTPEPAATAEPEPAATFPSAEPAATPSAAAAVLEPAVTPASAPARPEPTGTSTAAAPAEPEPTGTSTAATPAGPEPTGTSTAATPAGPEPTGTSTAATPAEPEPTGTSTAATPAEPEPTGTSATATPAEPEPTGTSTAATPAEPGRPAPGPAGDSTLDAGGSTTPVVDRIAPVAEQEAPAAGPSTPVEEPSPFWARVDAPSSTARSTTASGAPDDELRGMPEPPWPDEFEDVGAPSQATPAAQEDAELPDATRSGVGVSVADRATFESTVCSLVDDRTEFTVAFVGLDEVSGPSLGVPDDPGAEPAEEAACRALLWSLARRSADRGTCYSIGRGLVAVVLDRGRPKDVDKLVKRLPSTEVSTPFSWGAARFPDEANDVRELLRMALVRLANMREEKLTPRILVNKLRRAVTTRG